MKKLIIFTLVLGLYACKQHSQSITHIPIEQYEPKATDVLIDVRTPEEYAAGHLEHAVNIDFYGDDFLKNFEQFDKTQPIYIYCKIGRRSGMTVKELENIGFQNIINLEGGMTRWNEHQKPTGK
ncbi:MAG: rhodanese-like domain-containing protein [Capnocytophaga sp.]|nr:rhodanese-like domain-containing protein [Capnocytophaga sp.]